MVRGLCPRSIQNFIQLNESVSARAVYFSLRTVTPMSPTVAARACRGGWAGARACRGSWVAGEGSAGGSEC